MKIEFNIKPVDIVVATIIGVTAYYSGKKAGMQKVRDAIASAVLNKYGTDTKNEEATKNA